jgi:hypothetical protein
MLIVLPVVLLLLPLPLSLLLLLLLLLALQFAWLEAARAAGLSGKLFMGQHLQQLDGEITLDYLPSGGETLPHIPGEIGLEVCGLGFRVLAIPPQRHTKTPLLKQMCNHLCT